MSRSLLHLVLRHADGLTAGPDAESDAELLRRFARDRDQAAFAELLRRHGPMVWAVCRHLLPDQADAEDAFQVTFLALVRSAGSVRNGNAVAGWLHGVAVRVATKLKRTAARRRQREKKAAGGEADRSVPGATWDALLAAVHEEVQRLPDPLRAAFVLCDLEGVRQPDAAARLGWKPGTLTGRLARARQLLVQRLAGRGLAPAAAGGTVGLGVATAAGAVPAGLIDRAVSLSTAGGAAPPALLNLLREVTPMALTRTKLAAAAVLVAGGVGTVLFPLALAQEGAGGGAPPGAPAGGGSAAGAPPAGGAPPPGAGDKSRYVPSLGPGLYGVTPPGSPPGSAAPGTSGGPQGMAPGGYPGMPGVSGGGMAVAGAVSSSRAEWEHLLLNKPATAAEFKKLLDARGKEGWEFAGVVDFSRSGTGISGAGGGIGIVDGGPVVVFKRHKGGGARAGGGGYGGMMGAMAGMMSPPGGGGANNPFGQGGSSGPAGSSAGGPPMGTGPMSPGRGSAGPMGGASGPGMPGSPLGGGAPGGRRISIIRLQNAAAADLALVLEKVFPGDVAATPDPRTNSLILRATDEAMKEVRELIERLDQPDGDSAKPGGGRRTPRTNVPIPGSP